MIKEEIQKILELHSKWLRNESGGVRAELSGANLSVADLRNASLRGANLRNADLRNASLRGANLRNADLRNANLSDADLRGANLSDADLSDADLRNANLSVADLRNANLRGANLSSANLKGAELSGANLSGVVFGETTSFYSLQCPEEGSFIAWKKCAYEAIVKLEIPSHAKRSSATSRKCRASEAIVLNVLDKEGNEIEEGISEYDNSFKYVKGQTVRVDNFEEDRWEECAPGIHFFITKEEAIQYK